MATIVPLFLENQKRGICAGDVAMNVVIKAYLHRFCVYGAASERLFGLLGSEALKRHTL